MRLIELLSLFVALIFLSHFAAAQPFGLLTLEEIYAIAVILLVIFAIAIAAGWRARVGIPTGMIIFGMIVLLLVVLPFFVKIPEKVLIPERWKLTKLPDFWVKGMAYIGLPKEWGYVPAFIYLVILPFAAIFAVTWGFLRQLRIFEDKVVRVLSLLITFATIPLGILTKMVYFYLGISGFVAISTFIVTFVLGVVLVGVRKVSVYELKLKSLRTLRKQLGDVYKQIEELRKQHAKAIEEGRLEDAMKLLEKINRLESVKRGLEREIRELPTS